MKKLFEILVERSRNGQATMLVTVVADVGSAPRGAGASMIVGEDGRILGTIGGGMLEYRSTQEAQKDLAAGKGRLREYRLTKEEVAGLGMVCGGNVDVLFTYIAPTDNSKAALMTAKEHLVNHRTGWILLPLDGSGLGFYSDDSGLVGIDVTAAPGQKELIDHTTSIIETASGKYYTQKLMNTSRVYIFGGGHLSQELVPLLDHLGFRCVVTDDRAEFSTKELFPCAEELHTLNYSELDGKFDVQPQDFIVIVTRGHAGDYECEKFALKTPAYYIGAVGSRTKIAEVNRKLRADGFTDQDIARITSPIGIDIKSETPAEIAVSIAAQLIARRAEQHK
jgi:xanthine dehydrogenase accessory factor